MTKVNWNLWKMTFPFKCSKCGHLSNNARHVGSENPIYCEGCGSENTMIETTKEDYKEIYKKNKG